MKKLYRRATVHPSPPIVSNHLSFLPATILALAAALSLEDRELLAYLISSPNTNNNLTSSPSSRKTTTTPAANNNNKKSSSAAKGGGGSGDHPARFNCSCFRCYTSYWVRWDESPNRELIHEIIDAFEDGLHAQSSSKKGSSAGSKYGKKDKRHHNKRGSSGNGPGQGSEPSLKKKDHQLVKTNILEERNSSTDSGDVDGDEGSKGSVRRFVSFLGERIWGGVWSQ